MKLINRIRVTNLTYVPIKKDRNCVRNGGQNIKDAKLAYHTSRLVIWEDQIKEIRLIIFVLGEKWSNLGFEERKYVRGKHGQKIN